MYFFRGDFGCMLFTGDFRWEKSGKGAENGSAVLLDALKNQALDNLYLDNTYCNPIFSFPSREVAAEQVGDIITSHPDHEIVIAIDSMGKEDLLLYVSQALNIKIWVWPERLQIMNPLGFHQNFTTQTSLTRVRAISRCSFSCETLEALNTLRPTLGIMASGLPWFLEAVKKDGRIFGCSTTHVRRTSVAEILAVAPRCMVWVEIQEMQQDTMTTYLQFRILITHAILRYKSSLSFSGISISEALCLRDHATSTLIITLITYVDLSKRSGGYSRNLRMRMAQMELKLLI